MEALLHYLSALYLILTALKGQNIGTVIPEHAVHVLYCMEKVFTKQQSEKSVRKARKALRKRKNY